jgi:hypothetical protein
MLIRRLKESSIELMDIEPVEADLLREVPGICDSGAGDSRSEARMFSSPADSSQGQFLSDWAEYVQPELRYLFRSARNTVKEDLEHLSDCPGRLARLVIPRAHSDAWLNALNQARLILASKYNFSNEELSMHRPPKWFSRRDLILQQINFYAEIQERIIDAIEDELAES